MRHLKAGKRLGITTSHRKAMMRNLVTSLLEHGEIKTTITRAKEMRKYFDKMIGLGKKDGLHARRQAISYIKSKEAVKKLFEEYGPLYSERNGGYTRIFRIGRRLGDNAEMALIQMVDLDGKAKKDDNAGKEKIKELKEELEEKASSTDKTDVEKIETEEQAQTDVVEAAEVKQDSEADETQETGSEESKVEVGKEEK
ncbi:50S ribosomal protein L17 [bacterium]|nr:50S ribosomal protein L17 [bacterium]